MFNLFSLIDDLLLHSSLLFNVLVTLLLELFLLILNLQYFYFKLIHKYLHFLNIGHIDLLMLFAFTSDFVVFLFVLLYLRHHAMSAKELHGLGFDL